MHKQNKIPVSSFDKDKWNLSHLTLWNAYVQVVMDFAMYGPGKVIAILGHKKCTNPEDVSSLNLWKNWEQFR